MSIPPSTHHPILSSTHQDAHHSIQSLYRFIIQRHSSIIPFFHVNVPLPSIHPDYLKIPHPIHPSSTLLLCPAVERHTHPSTTSSITLFVNLLPDASICPPLHKSLPPSSNIYISVRSSRMSRLCTEGGGGGLDVQISIPGIRLIESTCVRGARRADYKDLYGSAANEWKSSSKCASTLGKGNLVRARAKI